LKKEEEDSRNERKKMFNSNLLIPRRTAFDMSSPSRGAPLIDSKFSQRNTLKRYIGESDSGLNYSSNHIAKDT